MAFMTDGSRNKQHFFDKYFKEVSIDAEDQEAWFEAEIDKDTLLSEVGDE